MPLRLFQPAPVVASSRVRRPVVASGKQLDLMPGGGEMRRTGVPMWQRQAWEYFDRIGEVRYAARYFASSLSRIRLFVGWRDDPSQPVVPITDDDRPAGLDVRQYQIADQMLDRLHGVDGTTAGILSAFGTNLFVAGEGCLVGRTVEDRERWDFYSVEQIVWHDQRWKIRQQIDDTPDRWETLTPDEDVVVRVWQPHPRFVDQADSPMRSVLGICEELLLLSASVRASAMSRVPAGILVLPDTILDGGVDSLDGSGIDGEAGADRTLQDIVDHFVTPIGDPESAAAVVPHVLAMDPEDCDRVKWIEPSRSVDETAAKQRTELLVRLANGVDLPPEVLTGMSGTNHWSAWLIDEQSYRTHLAPAIALFANALTEGLVRPALQVAGMDPDPRLVIGFDPTDLVSHPDRKSNARDGHAALVLSDDTLRRALGFGDEDAPDEDEYVRRVALRQGAKDLTPVAAGEMTSVVKALGLGAELGVTEDDRRDDDDRAPERSPDEPAEVVEGPPPEPDEALVASAERELGAELMSIDRSLLERLDALADAAMSRALERAGAKVRSRLARDVELRPVLASVGNDEVVAAVGRDGLTAAGMTEDELLEDEFESLADEFVVLAGLGSQRAREALLRRARRQLPEAQDRIFEDRLVEDLAAARELLVAGMVAAAAALLLDRGGRPRPGEALEGRRAPTTVVRDALSRAGGGATGGGPLGGPAAGGDGGSLLATGPTFDEMAVTVGFRKVAERWVYGTALRDTFQPHLDLDGVEFASEMDDVLTNTEDWPVTSHYFPGDHDGCLCMTEPIFEAVADVEEVVFADA